MTLPFPNGTTNGTTYAYGLASALQQVYLYDPDWALEADPEVYEKMLRDPVVSGAFDQLLRLVVGHDWFLDPAGEDPKDRALAKLLEDLQRETPRLPSVWYNLAMASLKGCTWGRIYLEERELTLGDGKSRPWIVVSDVRDVDKRRFRRSRVATSKAEDDGKDSYVPGWKGLLAAQPGKKPQADTGEGSSDWEPVWHWEFHQGVDPKSRSTGWWTPLFQAAPRDLWIQHVVDTSERGLGYGYGLGADLYYYFFAKAKVLKSALQGIDRWGQGFLVQAVDALRDGNASGQTAQAKLQAVIRTLSTARSENVYAFDKRDDVRFLDVPGSALEFVVRLLDYLDAKITSRILAAIQPTGGDRGSGSYASAKIEQDSCDAAVSFLRSPLEETWTRSVVGLLTKKNEANLRELGLWGRQIPRQRLRGREVSDPDQVVKILTCARDLGLRVKREELYSLLGLSIPNDEDKAVDLAAMGQQLDQAMGGLQARAGLVPGAPKPQIPGAPQRQPVGSAGSSVADKNGVHA